MMSKKILLGMAVVLCVSSLAGCGEDNKENDNSGLKKVPITEDGDSLISNCDLHGHVVEFSDTGCTISSVESEQVDGGELAVAAQPGYEEEEKNVNVYYADNCQYQIAKINISTGKADVSNADLSDIKKQTDLLIYGEWSDDHNIEATKAIIYRFE